MREMKDSGIEWIGEIPKDWKVTSLKRLAKIQTGTSPTKKSGNKNYSDEIGIPWIKAENLNSFKSIRETSEYLTEHGQKLGKIFPAYTVYVCCIASIGKVGYSDIICSCNQQINGLIFNKILNWKFGFYETIAASEEYNARTNISVTPIINSSEQGGIKFVVPSLSEQQSIASFLDSKCADIDALSSDIEKQIETLKEYKKSLITHAVTKGLNPNVEMKDSGIEWIGEIPKHWTLGKIKAYVNKVGSGKTPKGDARLYTEGNILFLRSQNIYNTGIALDAEPTVITDAIDKEMSNTRVHQNDVLLNITGGSIGRCCIYNLNRRANVNQHVCIIRTKIDMVIPSYMHYFWISDLGQNAIKIYQTGGNREGMSADAIKNTPIPITSISEQQSIASFLDSKCADIDAAISGKEQQLETLKEYKKSLIYTYVTGKKEVPEGE